MYRVYVVFFTFLCLLTASSQQEAKKEFTEALSQLMTQNMEMTIEIKEWSSNEKFKLKKYAVLMGQFKDVDRIKTVIQQPEKAKGITIVIEKTQGGTGIIEIYTPANGKTRKLKATPKNMALVNSGSSISNFGNIELDNMRFDPLERERYEEKDCFKITIWDKKDDSKGKTVYLVDQRTHYIYLVTEFNVDNSEKSTTMLSNYKKVASAPNKIQPMQIIHLDSKSSKKSEIAVLQINPRPNLEEVDFEVNKLVN
ncbi:outer membrane lipoprotein-sorting protein [Eudoraea chungangensis]|uniref:outer membrane lipoprotein-sorting protein n=1 Tax=Eudoraea chungangensis TaxID=1481905 RepID=UPI0023EB0651|nr:outer membrane lipoprotein-sorting protein [Eudoraea chungangensis]